MSPFILGSRIWPKKVDFVLPAPEDGGSREARKSHSPDRGTKGRENEASQFNSLYSYCCFVWRRGGSGRPRTGAGKFSIAARWRRPGNVWRARIHGSRDFTGRQPCRLG